MLSDTEFYYYNTNKIIYYPIYNYIKNDYFNDLYDIFKCSMSLIKHNLINDYDKRCKCVILDLDESFVCNDYYLFHTLDLYNFNKDIKNFYKNRLDKSYGPILPFMIILYEYLISKNIKVIFLTGRNKKFKKSTINNLKYFNIYKFELIMKSNNINSKLYKTNIINELDKIYNIILCINDQDEFIHKNLIKTPKLYNIN
jgi:hypothetical protein